MKKKIPWPITVRTKRIELRPYKLSDYEIWKEAFTKKKPKQHKYDSGPLDRKRLTKSFYRKLYFRHERLVKKDECYPFGIYERKTGAHIGVIDISTICRDWYQWANLGYRIHNTYQNRGYGREAAEAAIRIAFKHLGYKRVEASICPDNWRSIKLARSLGMKREGMRKEFIFDNGRWDDHVIYAIVNPKQRKRAFPML